jgi:transcriptional regulator with XRE-family HTH domain
MLTLTSPTEIAMDLARRIRARRLRRGWTQKELAERAGMKPATYVLFERTGRISLIRLLKVLDVVELIAEVEKIGRQEDLADLTLDQVTRPERQRGKRQARRRRS